MEICLFMKTDLFELSLTVCHTLFTVTATVRFRSSVNLICNCLIVNVFISKESFSCDFNYYIYFLIPLQVVMIYIKLPT